MLIGRIRDANMTLGAPKDWDEARDGHCGALPVRAGRTSVGFGLTSAWFPTTDELAALMAGAPIHLTIHSQTHPVVSLGVGEPPSEDDA